MQMGKTSLPATVLLVSEISRINVVLPPAQGNSENRSIEVICFEGIIGSDQMKKAQKKLTLSKIDFLSSVIIIGLD